MGVLNVRTYPLYRLQVLVVILIKVLSPLVSIKVVGFLLLIHIAVVCRITSSSSLVLISWIGYVEITIVHLLLLLLLMLTIPTTSALIVIVLLIVLLLIVLLLIILL